MCAGCHKITDPMGLALENFDGAGQYRDAEKGAKINTSGSLDGKEFTDVIGLGQAMHDHPALTSCLTKRVFAYSTVGKVTNEDQDVLNYINARFAQAGYRLPELLRVITNSTAFSEIRETQPAVKTAEASSQATSSVK